MHGEVVCDIPVPPLAEDAPNYDRPWTPPKKRAPLDIAKYPEPEDYGEVLLKLMSCPDMASKRWIWEQYDHTVMGDTLIAPGGDAALVRIHNSNRAVAITTDVTPRYVKADPHEGGKQAVAETYRNICATGASPLAITNCLNFGNPERPEIMAQFVGAIEGIAEACERQSACCHFLEFVDAEHTREDTVKIAAHSCPPNNTGDGPVYIGPACKETIE